MAADFCILRRLLTVILFILTSIRSGTSQMEGCNQIKICLNLPDEPSTFIAIEYLDTNSFEFTLSAKIDGYVALGFSRDTQMGDDGVFACLYNDKDKNPVDVKISKNDGHQNAPLAHPDIEKQINKIQTSRFGDQIFCKFQTQARLNFGNYKFDLEHEPVHLLIAQGPSTSSNLEKHSVQVATAEPVNLMMFGRQENGLVESAPLDFGNSSLINASYGSTRLISESKDKTWMKLHAVFMIIAWIIFLPIGAMVSRFFKETWTDIHIFGRRFWFCLHIVCMISAFVFAIFGCIFIQINRGYIFVPDSKTKSFDHCIMGLVAVFLMAINISSFWIPFKSKTKKDVQFIFHFVFGIGSFYIGVVNIALTPTWLGKDSILPCYTPYNILIWWIIHLAIYLLISLLITINDHSNARGWIDYDGWRAFSIPMRMVYSGEAPSTTLRKSILLLYIMVSLIMAIFLMASVKDQYNC